MAAQKKTVTKHHSRKAAGKAPSPRVVRKTTMKDRLDGLSGEKRKAAVKEIFTARKANTRKALDGTSGAERKARYKALKDETMSSHAKSKKITPTKAKKQAQAKRNAAARTRRTRSK